MISPRHAAARRSRKSFVAFTVTRAEQGQPLQMFLAERLKESKRQAKDRIDARAVFVNRQCIWMARHVLQGGDAVEVQMEAAAPDRPRVLRVLAESEHYLFVDKPYGMLTIGPGSLETLLREQLKQPALRCVHRLDRDTSGCLLVARTATAFERAVAVFKTRRVKKLYDVLVVGRLVQPVSTIDTPLDGQPARTHVRRLTANEDVTFARVRIETGRTHQIRLHLASVRHPVVGDRLHGLKLTRDPRLMRVPRQMLHATELELDDPMGSGRLHAHSPLPADFRRCLQMFGLGK
ncbi:MAG: RluA family pseudouridine synthase [Lentisphaerae bacterium]|nr:RluA family pseudouridine synthase [Lentisphaerota bacterium]